MQNNPSYAHKKEVPQADKIYALHPPLDLSMLAERNLAKPIPMVPPPKRVKVFNIQQSQNNRSFVGSMVIPNLPTYKFVSEIDDSQFTFTGRIDAEMQVLSHDAKPAEPETAVNSTSLNTTQRHGKLLEGRGGGFKVVNKDKNKRINSTSKVTKKLSPVPSKNAELTKGDYAHFLSEIGIRNENPSKSRHLKNNSMIPSGTGYNPGNVLQGNKNTVRGLIDKMYQREKKYIKQYYKEDYIQKNDFIFNLDKTHQLKLSKSREDSQNNMTGTYALKDTKSKSKMAVSGFNN